jgi:hypothetical protein
MGAVVGRSAAPFESNYSRYCPMDDPDRAERGRPEGGLVVTCIHCAGAAKPNPYLPCLAGKDLGRRESCAHYFWLILNFPLGFEASGKRPVIVARVAQALFWTRCMRILPNARRMPHFAQRSRPSGKSCLGCGTPASLG